jgi:hypothetical protein
LRVSVERCVKAGRHFLAFSIFAPQWQQLSKYGQAIEMAPTFNAKNFPQLGHRQRTESARKGTAMAKNNKNPAPIPKNANAIAAAKKMGQTARATKNSFALSLPINFA